MGRVTGSRSLDIDLFGDRRYRPTPDPSLSVTAPVLRRLLNYWKSKAAIRPPRRVDIDPIEIGKDLPSVVLLDIAHDPLRFRWRLIGGEIAGTMRRDSTGKRFEDVYQGPVLVDMLRLFSRVALTGRPIRHLGTACFLDRDYLRYESLHLPLFDGDGQVCMMLGGLHFRRIL